MNDIIKIDIINGKPAVTSLQVAEHFGKEHFNVLSDIERVMLQVSENFRKLNFQGSEYGIPNPLTGGELKKPMTGGRQRGAARETRKYFVSDSRGKPPAELVRKSWQKRCLWLL